jgi:hypothetical protein
MAWYERQISDVIDVRTFTTLYRRDSFENRCLLWAVATDAVRAVRTLG